MVGGPPKCHCPSTMGYVLSTEQKHAGRVLFSPRHLYISGLWILGLCTITVKLYSLLYIIASNTGHDDRTVRITSPLEW